MKKIYTNPDAQVVALSLADVIATSYGVDSNGEAVVNAENIFRKIPQ